MFHNHLTLLGAHHAHIGKRQFLGLGHGKQKIWKGNVILRINFNLTSLIVPKDVTLLIK